jgi:hypothetical protein
MSNSLADGLPMIACASRETISSQPGSRMC